MFLLIIAALCGLVGLALMAVGHRWPTAVNQHRQSAVSGRRSKELARDLLAIGLLALLTAAFFWRLLFQRGVWMPAGGGDLAGFLYPTYHFAAESLRRGEIPLWNPYLYGGTPHVADVQSGVFYPINLLVFFAAPQLTYRLMELLAVFHVFLAGVAMYLCLRFLGRMTSDDRRTTGGISWAPVVGRWSFVGQPACLVSAIAFMFSDFFVIHFGNLNLIAVTAWLPLVFLGAYRALVDRSLGWALFGGGVLGVAALAGHAQPLQFILIVMALLTLYHLIADLRFRIANSVVHPAHVPKSEVAGNWRDVVRRVGLVALVVAIGLGVAALSLLPAVEMVRYTRRTALSYAEAARYSLPPLALMGLLVPDLFGRGVEGFWGPWPRVEVGYLGVLPLVLAVIALILRRDDPRVRFFALLAALSLLLALGEHTPLHRVAYALVPGFRNLRAPARFTVLTDFALGALAAFGLDALLRTPQPLLRGLIRRALLAAPLVAGATLVAGYLILSRTAPPPDRVPVAVRGLVGFVVLLGAAVLLVVARARGRLGARVTGVLAVALIAWDLIALGSGVDVGHRDPTANFRRPRIVEFLRGDPSLYRIEVRPEAWGWWSPDTALLYGFYDTGGIYNPLRLSDYQLFWEGLTDRSTRLYDFLNAKYVIAPPGYGLPADKFVPVLEDKELTVYLNQEALPRVLMVYDARLVEDHTAAFQAVHAGDFDPTRTVILEEIPRPATEPFSHPATLPPRPPGLAIADYRLNSLAVDVATAAPGYLVLSEVWYPGWQATVDGRPAPVLRANYTFRALRVPAGRHRVRLSFSPPTWKIGVAISVAVLAGTILAAGWLLSRHVGWHPRADSKAAGQFTATLKSDDVRTP